MQFSNDYKQELYIQWYNAGKPHANQFIFDISPDEHGNAPERALLLKWISEWKEQSEEADKLAEQQINQELAASKIEMFQRHARIAKEMQDIALEYLKKNKDKLTPNTAVRLLVEGVDIEQSTAGVPEAIKKMLGLSDEELRENIVEILTSGEVEILDESENR